MEELPDTRLSPEICIEKEDEFVTQYLFNENGVSRGTIYFDNL